MVNRHRPHVLVLPEDDANRQIANGFLLDPLLRPRNIHVLEEVGGWLEVIDRFNLDHTADMEKYPDRYMVLLIDFDDKPERLQAIMQRIPDTVSARVFVLGSLGDPEELRKKLGSYETIGRALAKDCREGTYQTWRHELLKHNQPELDRLTSPLRPILFESFK